MDPKITNFMYINGVVVLALIFYMLFGRNKKNPSRLNLRETPARDKLDIKVDFKNFPEHEGRTERVLNVIFQYNGHDFDAFEVLGVAAGSSFETIENAYAELLKTSPDDAREFLQTAYNAIKRKLTRL